VEVEMTIQELADRAEVTTRTIRYYVEQGVLPPPGHGRPAEYTDEHLERLALIRRLKEQYLPLEEIRDTMQRLSLEEVAQLLEQYAPPTQEVAERQKLDSAADYIAGVLGRGAAREEMKRAAVPGPTTDDGRRTMGDGGGQAVEAESAPAGRPALPPMAAAPPAPSPLPGGATRTEAAGKAATAEAAATYIPSPAQEMDEEASSSPSSWERVDLGEGVELHYPARVDVHTRGKVARLIEAARRILGRDPGNGE
jgi:DNA-binding transcriptional MerR regulator